MAGVKKTASVKVFGQTGDFILGNPQHRVDFDADRFTQLLRTKGLDVLWAKALHCPKRDASGPYEHAVSCSVCDGSGWVYFDETSTRMLVQSIKLDQSFYMYGRFDSGEVMVTSEAADFLNVWDRITLQNGEHRYQEMLYRQPSTLFDRPKYDVLELEQVQWVDRDGAVQVAAVDTDVQVSSGQLEWLTLNRPDIKTVYSVSYKHRPIYIVQTHTHQFRESPVQDASGTDPHVEFPHQVIAKLDFLVRDESKDLAREDRAKNPFAFS